MAFLDMLAVEVNPRTCREPSYLPRKQGCPSSLAIGEKLGQKNEGAPGEEIYSRQCSRQLRDDTGATAMAR